MAGSATTVRAGPEIDIELASDKPSHFVLMAANPIRQSYAEHDPLMPPAVADVAQKIARVADGRFLRNPPQ